MPDKTDKQSFLSGVKSWAKTLKTNVYALYFAYKDPQVPWYAKAVIAVVLTYSFTHIDLIPDFIPVIGYIDDLIIIPLGIALALRLIPAEALEKAREKAMTSTVKPGGRVGAIAVILFWAAGLALMITYGLKLLH